MSHYVVARKQTGSPVRSLRTEHHDTAHDSYSRVARRLLPGELAVLTVRHADTDRASIARITLNTTGLF